MKANQETLVRIKSDICAIADAVRALSGASVAFYDLCTYLSATGIGSVLPGKLMHHDCEYCGLVRRLPGGRVRCINCDRFELAGLIRQGDTSFVHSCFAGLTEMVVPILYRDRLFAAAYVGQARIDDSIDEDVLKTLTELGGPASEITAAYRRLPKTSIDKLRAAAVLLKHSVGDVLRRLPDQMITEADLSNNYSVSSQVATIINRRPDRYYTIRDIADELFMSPEMLSRLYRRETGVSLKAHLDATSYFLAQRLLKEERMSIESISVNLGFSSPNELRRWLRKQSAKHNAALEIENVVIKQYTRRAQDHLHAHFQENLKVEQIAQDMGISPDHLNRVFKKETGQTITQALWSMRIESAKRALEQTSLPIALVASRNGFKSKKDFSARFLQQTGMLPEEYRKRPK